MQPPMARGFDFKPLMLQAREKEKALFLNAQHEVMKEVKVRDIKKDLEKAKDIHSIVFDGVITQRLIDSASEKKIAELIGVKKGKFKDDKGVKVILA